MRWAPHSSSKKIKKIMNMIYVKSSLIAVIILICLLIISPGSALIFLTDGTEMAKDQIPDIFANATKNPNPPPLQFFYNYDCLSCQQALDYLRALEKKNPEIAITHYNLAYPEENNVQFTRQKARFNTTKIHYPAVFIGDVVVSGSSDIIHYTEPLAEEYANWR